MSQSRRGSVVEAITNTAVGYSLAVACQAAVFPLFGIHVSLETNMGIGVVFTVLSLVRSYVLRRVFNSIKRKSVE